MRSRLRMEGGQSVNRIFFRQGRGLDRERASWGVAGAIAALMVLAGAVGVGAALVDPGVAPSADAASFLPACAEPVRDDTPVGRACPVAYGGWRSFFADGTSALIHGYDLPIPEPEQGEPGPDTIVAHQPICVADPATEYHNYALYIVPLGKTNNYTTHLANIRTQVKNTNGWLRDEGAENNAAFIDYRFQCVGAGDVTIAVANVQMTIPHPWNPDDVVNDLKAQGYGSTFAKYWLFVDNQDSLGGCGWGYVQADDDQPGVGNLNNVGPGYSAVFNSNSPSWPTSCWTTNYIMHEAGHQHGAVQITAPHSDYTINGQHHCTDQQDIMCYNFPQVCGYDGGTKNFDCNHDDYFNAGTATGWLATHWNLGHVNHRFILNHKDCNTAVEAPDTHIDAVLITLPQTNCSGALNNDLDPDDWFKFAVTSGQVIKVTMTPNSAANFNVGLWSPGKVLKVNSNTGELGGTESITFTADSTGDWRARVFIGQGSGNGLYTLSVCKNC